MRSDLSVADGREGYGSLPIVGTADDAGPPNDENTHDSGGVRRRFHNARPSRTCGVYMFVLGLCLPGFVWHVRFHRDGLNTGVGFSSKTSLQGSARHPRDGKGASNAKLAPNMASHENSRRPLLPQWQTLPWYPYPAVNQESVVIGRNTSSDIPTFIGYLQVCEKSHKSTGTQLFYQPISTGSTRNVTLPIRIPNQCKQQMSTNSTPPPLLIRMTPGNHYILVLINRSTEPTNLHTHGLHISGVGQVDDITRTVSPDHCLEYHYNLTTTDADVGTFFFHSHRHPIASHQVEHGAFGFLIVDETPSVLQNYYPHHLRAFLQHEILLQYYSVLDKTTDIRTNAINGIERSLSLSTFKHHPQDFEPLLQPLLELKIHRNEWYYLRLSFVVASDAINFVQFHPPSACEVRVVAYDGVYRSEIPSHFTLNRHMMTVSSRVDLAVQCSAEMVELHFYQEENNETPKLSDATKLVVIETYDDDDRASKRDGLSTMPSPFWDPVELTSWKPRRPYYMEDLLHPPMKLKTDLDVWNVSMDQILAANGSKILSINHDRWDPLEPIRSIKLGQLVEWTVNTTGQHPFHIHINRMQIVQPGGCGYRYEYGEYFDSIASENESCKVRIHFEDFAGRVVAHCHKFKHEDRGMMVWFNVTDGPGAGVLAAPEQECSW